jgi:hypothetical protein
MKKNGISWNGYFMHSCMLEQQRKETEHETKLALPGGIMYRPGSNQEKYACLLKNPVIFQETAYAPRSL